MKFYPFNLHQNTLGTSMVHVITQYFEADRENSWQMPVSEMEQNRKTA